jgi:serine/threonine protein kinase
MREGPQFQAGEFLWEGRLKLLESLRSGGFATIWKGIDRQRHELVAIKVLHGQHVEDRSCRERFFAARAEWRRCNIKVMLLLLSRDLNLVCHCEAICRPIPYGSIVLRRQCRQGVAELQLLFEPAPLRQCRRRRRFHLSGVVRSHFLNDGLHKLVLRFYYHPVCIFLTLELCFKFCLLVREVFFMDSN